MPAPRLLIVEGNTPEARKRQIAGGGVALSEGYANLLHELLPEAVIDICYPADSGANLPDGTGLEAYDGIAVTGSALNIYDGGPPIVRQIELARTALKSGTPMLGSCWGLQLFTVAAGGSVRKNPAGRELGFARHVRLNEAGRAHPMYAGKPDVFDALAVHLDEVETLAPGATALAGNAASQIQAFELRHGPTVAWAMQYHPEFTATDMAAVVRRYGHRLVEEGFFTDDEDLAAYADDLTRLDATPPSLAIAWRYGVGEPVLNKALRVKEIANWIDHQVLPTRSRRGRAWR